MMVVEDKEGMGLATGGVALFLSQFISKTRQHTTGAHGWEQLGFILILAHFYYCLQPSERERSHPSD